MDPFLKDLILNLAKLLVIVASANIARLWPGFKKKLQAVSKMFNDLSKAFDDDKVTDEEFDELFQDFRQIALDPPEQPKNPDLWTALKGPAFKFAFALLGVAIAILVVAEIVFRVLLP